MAERGTWQLHANVNTDWADSALRVTITYYDDQGYETRTRTWRRHVKGLAMDSPEWQAFAAVGELYRLMAHACGSELKTLEIDTPMF